MRERSGENLHACAEVLRAHMHNAVNVKLERDIDLRHKRRAGDQICLKKFKQVSYIACAFALTHKHKRTYTRTHIRTFACTRARLHTGDAYQ